MKDINLQDMAKMYKKEFEFLNKELERLESLIDSEDYKLTKRDDTILAIAHDLMNPPHTISNSQLAFLWNMDKRATNRIATDLTTKKLPKFLPKETPEDMMESFYRLSGVPAINEESDKDYAIARKIADTHREKGPVTTSSAKAYIQKSGEGVDNLGMVVQIANEILGYAGLDEGKAPRCSQCGDWLEWSKSDKPDVKGKVLKCSNCGHEKRQKKVNEVGGGAGAAVAGVPGAAKPGKGYTMVGAGTGGTGPSYGGEELEERKSPNSGAVSFHFTTEDGLPYFGEADVVISKDVDDARGPITTIDSIRVKSIVDQEGNPVAITDEMKSAAKQAVEEMEDIDLMVSAGYEDDDYSNDGEIDEESLTDIQYLPKEPEPSGPIAPKPGSSCINEENEGVMKTLATRKLYKGRESEEDPLKQLQRKDVWIPKEKKSDVIAKFKDRVQKMLKEMQLEEAPGTETITEPEAPPAPTKTPDKTDEPRNPLKRSPGVSPKPKAEESTNPDASLFIKNRGLNRG